MIILYNFFVILGTVSALPFIALFSLFNRRLRYRLKDRFIPSVRINRGDYILLHGSSLGEVKTLKEIEPILKRITGRESVFSVFTDTAHSFLKNDPVILMPVDFYPLYHMIFKRPPEIAFFFETEIWPSYLHFLKKHGTKLILLNARISRKTAKSYKLLPIFGKTISLFDLIVAKSEEDAERFRSFSDRVTVCGNIKLYKKVKDLSPGERKKLKKQFKIETTKPILTLGSVHKEEMETVLHLIRELIGDFFIVVAPRHMEDVGLFLKNLKKEHPGIVSRTEEKNATSLLLLDTIGELEKVYAISRVAIVGGSFHKSLKGHNPFEPIVHGAYTIVGPFMESFKNETEQLRNLGALIQINKAREIIPLAKDLINSSNTHDSQTPLKKFKSILDCYIDCINRILYRPKN